MSLVDWDANKKIAITAPTQSSELTDFPVLVNLSGSSGVGSFDCSAVFTDLGANSKKIAVEIGDTGEQCFVEIERWDHVNESAQLWVKIPTVSASASTVLNLYYDSTHGDNLAHVGEASDNLVEMVVDAGEEGTYDTVNSYAPCVIKESDTSYKMWYAGYDGTNLRVLYCTSVDGKTWSNHQLVVDKGDEGTHDTTHASTPHVIKESDTSYKMWYAGYDGTNYSILYCTSTNGISWTNHQQVLDVGAEGTYDTTHIYTPYVIKESDTSYKMWYSAQDGTNYRTLYCTSTNGTSWSNHQLVVNISAEGTYDTTHAYYPCVVKESDTSYKMWYSGFDGTNNRILYCTSTNGTSWTNHQMIMDIGMEGTYDTVHVSMASIIRNGTSYQIWYAGKDSTNNRVLNSILEEGVTLTTPSRAVWNSDLKAIYHMGQDPSGAAPQILDSTSNAKHGTSAGTMTSGDLVDGLIGKALDFDGVDDYVSIGSAVVSSPTEFTWWATVKSPTSDTTEQRVIVYNHDDIFVILSINGGTADLIRVYVLASTGGGWSATTTAYSVTDFHTIVGRVKGGYLDLFVDGTKIGTSVASSGFSDSGESLGRYIGVNRALNSFSPSLIDEVGFSDVGLTDDWLEATYLSNTDTLFTFSLVSLTEKKIIITIPAQDTELTDFPILVNLTDSGGTGDFDCSDIFIELGANSKKIAVKIGDTEEQCYVEIEHWDESSSSAQLWVKVPTLSSTQSTILNLYYNSSYDDNDFITAADASDDFTGTDGDAPDEVKWEIINSTGCSATINNNKLRQIVPVSADDRNALAYYQHMFSGDFDTQVDFALISSTDPSSSSSYSNFNLTFPSGYLYVGHRADPGDSWIMIYDSVSGAVYDTPLATTKFRVTRVGSVLKAYVWNNSQWEWDGNTAGRTLGLSTTDDTTSIRIKAQGDFDGGTTIDWDNFTINSVDEIPLFVGNTGETPAERVWNDDFEAVYHFAQDPTGGTDCILDSTGNAHHGTPHGGMSSGDLSVGLPGLALDFNGVQWVEVPDHAGLDFGASQDYTVEMTVSSYTPPVADFVYPLRKTNTTSPWNAYYFIHNTSTGTYMAGGEYDGTTTYKNESTYAGTGLVDLSSVRSGTNLTVYTDGVIGNTITGAEGDLSNDGPLTIGGSVSAGVTYKGANIRFQEARISRTARSTDWLAATNLSNTDTLVALSVPLGTLPLLALVDMLYGNLTGTTRSYVDMLYAILFNRIGYVEQIYSMRLGAVIAMPYGDVAVLVSILNQYYWDCPEISKAIEQKYGDMRYIVEHVDMSYNIMAGILSYLEQKYSLAGDALLQFIEQEYNLNANSLLVAKIDQIYMLQEENRLDSVSTGVIVEGASLSPHHINVEYSIDSYVAHGEIHLSRESEYVGINRGDDFEITISGETHVFIVSSQPKRSRRGASATTYIVEGSSPAIKLSSPWSETLTCTFSADTAKNIFESLADPIIVDWQVVDYPVPADTLHANNEDKISIMRKLTQAVGAIIQSNPDGTLRVVYKYPTAVNKWDDASADYFLTDSNNFVSQDETFKHNSGFNRYQVSDTATPEDRIWPEMDDDGNIRAFEVPWANTPLVLDHTGSSGVIDPEYMGVIEVVYPFEDEDPEVVEFVAGYASSSKPMYDKYLNGDGYTIERTWLTEPLGAITYLEDGQMEAEVKDGSSEGYSLAAIRYLTRYHLWKIDNGTEEKVQYILKVA
jgi:hypothetical protein